MAEWYISTSLGYSESENVYIDTAILKINFKSLFLLFPIPVCDLLCAVAIIFPSNWQKNPKKYTKQEMH